MEEILFLIFKVCNFFPTNDFKRTILGKKEIIKSFSFLQFADVLILSSCSKFLREKIETKYKILFYDHFPLLKDLNLEDDKCYGTWMNFFKCFKEVSICDEILQLIDLEIPTDEKFIYIPVFPIPKYEMIHVIHGNDYGWHLLPKISHNDIWEYFSRSIYYLYDVKLNRLLTLITNSGKTSSDFINCGFFPISLKKLNDKINEILDISQDNIVMITNIIRNTPSYTNNFSLRNFTKKFTDKYFSENSDKEFSQLFLKYTKIFCKLYARENSFENLFFCYKNYSESFRNIISL